MRPCQFGNWRTALCVFLAALCLAAYGTTGAGYLAVVGPAPFRFLAVARPDTNKFVLPKPVPLPEPASVISQVEKVKASRTNATAAANSMSASSAPPADNGVPRTPGESSPQDAVVSPEMFLKYFNRSTNGASSVSAPIPFTPPKAATPSSSTATFSFGQ